MPPLQRAVSVSSGAHFRSTCGADRTAAAPHLIAVGSVGIDPGFEYQHFLIEREIGAGKSHPIYGMLYTVVHRGESAIVADPGLSHALAAIIR